MRARAHRWSCPLAGRARDAREQWVRGSRGQLLRTEAGSRPPSTASSASSSPATGISLLDCRWLQFRPGVGTGRLLSSLLGRPPFLCRPHGRATQWSGSACGHGRLRRTRCPSTGDRSRPDVSEGRRLAGRYRATGCICLLACRPGNAERSNGRPAGPLPAGWKASAFRIGSGVA